MLTSVKDLVVAKHISFTRSLQAPGQEEILRRDLGPLLRSQWTATRREPRGTAPIFHQGNPCLCNQHFYDIGRREASLQPLAARR
jgi:hypothetical protein